MSSEIDTNRVAPTPDIRIDPELQRSPGKYSVGVSNTAVGQLYRDLGFKDTDIARVRLDIKRSSPPHPFNVFGLVRMGRYNIISRTTTLYTDPIYEGYKIRQDLAKNISEGKSTQERDEENLQGHLTTKRLPQYLRTAPPQRGQAFANQLLLKSQERKLNEVLIHEAQHEHDIRHPGVTLILAGMEKGAVIALFLAASSKIGLLTPTRSPRLNKLIQGATLAAGVLSAMMIEYQIDPLERSARSAEEKGLMNPDYRSMIQLKPHLADSPSGTSS